MTFRLYLFFARTKYINTSKWAVSEQEHGVRDIGESVSPRRYSLALEHISHWDLRSGRLSGVVNNLRERLTGGGQLLEFVRTAFDYLGYKRYFLVIISWFV